MTEMFVELADGGTLNARYIKRTEDGFDEKTRTWQHCAWDDQGKLWRLAESLPDSLYHLIPGTGVAHCMLYNDLDDEAQPARENIYTYQTTIIAWKLYPAYERYYPRPDPVIIESAIPASNHLATLVEDQGRFISGEVSFDTIGAAIDYYFNFLVNDWHYKKERREQAEAEAKRFNAGAGGSGHQTNPLALPRSA